MQSGRGRSATPSLHIHLLGDFRLAYDGQPLTTVNSARLQSLLAYLFLHREAPQSRQHLAFLLWPDSTERQARTNLRKQVHYLRRALPNPDRFLHADAKTLQWLPEAPFTLDVAEFERALDQVEQANDTANAQALLEQAVDLYQGDLLPSCYDDWIIPERERLRQRFTRALDRLVQSLENQRAYSEAIRHAQTVLGENNANWDVDVIADDANDALVIQVTGSNATTVRWVAMVRTVEVGEDGGPTTYDNAQAIVQTHRLHRWRGGGASVFRHGSGRRGGNATRADRRRRRGQRRRVALAGRGRAAAGRRGGEWDHSVQRFSVRAGRIRRQGRAAHALPPTCAALVPAGRPSPLC
jgi:hypothetical protein